MEKYKPIVKKLAVFGCYAIAAVYIMVGLMALLSFLGIAQDDADEERIMDLAMGIPGGEIMIVIVILGLLGYIIWRVFEAFTDPYNFGDHFRGMVQRIGIGASAVGYLIITFSAAQILIEGGSNGEEDQQRMISQVLEFPAGNWLVGLAGALTGFAALVQFKYIYGGDYNKRFDYQSMPHWLISTTHLLAWAGYIARGVILGIIGYFLINAAISGNSQEVGDTDSAFDFMGDFGTAGHIGFIAVALGTMGYGIFMIIHGLYYSFQEGNEEE